MHRRKIDANRPLYEATLNHPIAVKTFNEFHQFIQIAKQEVKEGLLFDIHGQTHPEELLELGYLLSNKDLRERNISIDKCSIKSLATKSKYNFEDLIYGYVSLGHFVQEENLKVVPSPKHYDSMVKCYTGGYNTTVHGSLNGGQIDAIQLEIPKRYRNSNEYKSFSKHLASAICKYSSFHY